MTRLPLAPLQHVAGQPNITQLAGLLHVARRTVHTWQRHGLNIWTADRAACALGYHPLPNLGAAMGPGRRGHHPPVTTFPTCRRAAAGSLVRTRVPCARPSANPPFATPARYNRRCEQAKGHPDG